MVEFHNDVPQSSPYVHIIHCLNVLRDEIMCNADDTRDMQDFKTTRRVAWVRGECAVIGGSWGPGDPLKE